ncbi:Squalene synthase [Hypsibius exemplaris]|uniref:Squalene synthase n=1 Tax=Hypsibius exemplaris TaxID=2072580 RepID=A0A1W0WLT2_HYPEX|nr:Squalene synthase [Hypsibius exemplaris]
MELLRSWNHPDEIWALLKFKLVGCSAINSQCDLTLMSSDMRTCYEYLRLTSRSFCAVIMALDEDLRYAVCIYYLVLRALDTVEDDMTIPVDEKIPLLKAFHEKLYEPDWHYTQSKEKDRVVLENFNIISSEFRNLAPVFQSVIADSCREMGYGMTVFLDAKIDTYDQWDEYCHYVAGLVGIGLSKLFTASGLENTVVGQDEAISNSMGLFLQKTNIIRDYYEDILQKRLFWPKQAWIKYGNSLESLKDPRNLNNAVACLNELVTDALKHIPDVLTYLSRIRNQSVFNFCAIPQMMAIATLERCYNNPHVFRKNVKIRKGAAVRLMDQSTSMLAIRNFMNHFCTKIYNRIPPIDPNAGRTRTAVSYGIGPGYSLVRSDQSLLPGKTFYFALFAALLIAPWIRRAITKMP